MALPPPANSERAARRPPRPLLLVVASCAVAAAVAFLGVQSGGAVSSAAAGRGGPFRSLAKFTRHGVGAGRRAGTATATATVPRAPFLGGRERVRGPIFYNIYIPPPDDPEHPDGKRNALGIVREQLDAIDSSVRARDSPVRYALIGDTSAAHEIEALCQADGRRECAQLSAMEKGKEWATLQPLYEYCRDNPTKWVTYMHNKGSYHPSPENDIMRRMITKAALSEECQTVSSDQCNICSNRFTPLPFLHSSGNHWTASCEYVIELIPPLYFFPAMEEVFDEKVDKVLTWANGGKGWRGDPNQGGEDSSGASETKGTEEPTSASKIIHPTQDYASVTFSGRGRFAMEHWIHSHPRQRPCDVYPDKYAWAHDDLPPPPGDDWTPNLRPAPRGTLEDYVILPFARAPEDPWFCGMESRLYEFDKLYGEKPPEDSWFWSFYEASMGFCKTGSSGENEARRLIAYSSINGWNLRHSRSMQ